MFVCIVVCACSQHALYFKMLFLLYHETSFVITKGLLRDYFTGVGASQNYCVSHPSSRRSDSGLRMQVYCLKDKPNIRAVAKGDNPEVVNRTSVLCVFMHSNPSSTHCRVPSAYNKLGLQQNRSQGGRSAASWGCRSCAWPKT